MVYRTRHLSDRLAIKTGESAYSNRRRQIQATVSMSKLPRSSLISNCLLLETIKTSHISSRVIRSVAPCRNSLPNRSSQRSTTPLWLELQPCIKILAQHDRNILNLKPTRKNIGNGIRVQSVKARGHCCINEGLLGNLLIASARGALIYIKPRVNPSIIEASLHKQVATLTIISGRCTREIRVWERAASLRR